MSTTSEDLLARLTRAAYEVALRHGVEGPFLDVELEIWRALRGVLEHEQLPGTRKPDEAAAPVSVWARAVRQAV